MKRKKNYFFLMAFREYKMIMITIREERKEANGMRGGMKQQNIFSKSKSFKLHYIPK